MSTVAQRSRTLTLLAAGVSDVGRYRRHNEDRFLVHADGTLLVVADGMGGHASGDVAATLTTGVFEERARAASPASLANEEAVKQWLIANVSAAHTKVENHAQATHGCQGMGTTVVAVAYFLEEVHVVHVGDSRLYRLRAGTFEQLTQDHSLVEDAIRMGQLKREDAKNFPYRNVITRSVGQKAVADHKQFSPQPGDVLLLCSDGLCGVVPDNEIADILKGAASGNLSTICDELITAANNAGGPDNITAVVGLFE